MTPRTKKHPAAVALGRLGGTANTDAQNAARRANGVTGGRPSIFRLSPSGRVERRTDDGWRVLAKPYGATARAWLRRQQLTVDDAAVTP